MEPTRLLLIVGVRIYREGVKRVLDGDPRVEIVGAVATPGEAVTRLARDDVDAVLIDMATPAAPSFVRHLRPESCAVVAIGVEESEQAVVESAESGVEAFVSADAGWAELVQTVAAAVRGELVCSPRVAAILRRRVAQQARRPLEGDPARALTPRERDVLELVEDGLVNREIAQRLHIQPSTVKNHLHNVFKKLDVRDRDAAAMCARRLT
jgi:two-component system, NarL family, nitrate/nitrite response regulator NarL